jgi:hypothetical protein
MAVLILAGMHTGTVVKSHTVASTLYVLMLRLKLNITIPANIVSGKSTEWWGDVKKKESAKVNESSKRIGYGFTV